MEGTPLNYFTQAYGPAAIPTLYLDWAFTALSIAVCVIVAVLLLYAILRRRDENRATIEAMESAGTGWVYVGTAVSTLILFGFTVYMLVVLNGISHPPRPPGLTIAVTGYDWWWKADYENDDPSRRFTTANEIHIPTGEPILIELKSADVIHAFWVPTLAGKTQMIPGLANRQWLQADKPGIYMGQCTQYCGAQHAHMAFEIVAQSPEDFGKWQDDQLKPAPSVTEATQAGSRIFTNQCGGCHTVRGTDAQGGHAPDLTHIASRHMLAAGLMPNTPENLMDWIMHAQELKPGSLMPDIALSSEQQTTLASYLATLR